MANQYIERVISAVKARDGHQSEFLQAVEEVLSTLEPVIEKHPELEEHSILERIVEPDRMIMFRIPWVDDQGNVQVNRGFRVQFNNAIGPYKGGLRFHPSVNLGIIKFLGFEQIFKNALTGIPMGGGKGGSDFDPKGKSDGEVMRFCQSLMSELYRHIGASQDVPAGDIGVGGREIGYMFGMYKKITKNWEGVLTGKGWGWGGSLGRPEATGFGAVYFAKEMLEDKGDTLSGKTCLVSGSGNVSQFTSQKIMELGGKVLTLSDSKGCVFIPEGLTQEMWEFLMDLKNVRRGRISEMADKFDGVEYTEGGKPWVHKGDIAFPSATQNEINGQEAQTMIDNGLIAVSEGANMPSDLPAIELYLKNNILYGPAKAANAGGVSVSGLEMNQNSSFENWSFKEVDDRLKGIMTNIFQACKKAAEDYGQPGNYLMGANAAGFLKVANAMIDQGVQ
jgi:glutamate dehydrogenase (NADP+)